jgi:cysteine desulfurase
VPAIVGLGKASELASKELTAKMDHVRKLRDHLVKGIHDRIERVVPTGHPQKRLPGHASFCIEAIEGEALLLMLEQDGIYANTGSACASKALKTSPVLVAIKIAPDVAQGSTVFTLDPSNTMEEMDYVLERLPAAVDTLRSFSPLWGKKTAA